MKSPSRGSLSSSPPFGYIITITFTTIVITVLLPLFLFLFLFVLRFPQKIYCRVITSFLLAGTRLRRWWHGRGRLHAQYTFCRFSSCWDQVEEMVAWTRQTACPVHFL